MNSIDRLYELKKIRIVGFGSSNTECCYPNTFVPSWLNWLDYGLRKIFGRYLTTINSGVSGQTSAQLIMRLQEDVLFYQPHLIFITVGGNDSNPKNNLSIEDFHNNLVYIIDECKKIKDCEIILQSYYSPIYEKLPADYSVNFKKYMAEICKVAQETDTILFDHLPQWVHLRSVLGDSYENKFMDDPMHLNGLGNQLWAYNILSRLAKKEVNKAEKQFENVIQYQKILDSYKD